MALCIVDRLLRPNGRFAAKHAHLMISAAPPAESARMPRSKAPRRDPEVLMIGRRIIADRTWHQLSREMMWSRIGANLLQRQVAARMHTSISAVSRLENAAGHRPSLATIESYAKAVGCEVEIRFVRRS
jgi:hypothetical protein